MARGPMQLHRLHRLKAGPAHKLKGVLFLILDYGSCFLCLLATLLVITFPIFPAFFTYACMYG